MVATQARRLANELARGGKMTERLVLAGCFISLLSGAAPRREDRVSDTGTSPACEEDSSRDGEERTPLAGEPFEAELFGHHIKAGPRQRRSVSVWDAGVAITPGAGDSTALPAGSLYIWHHPSRLTLLRSVLIGVYNDVLLAKSAEGLTPFEAVLTLNTLTLPLARTIYVDGRRLDDVELYWGRIRAGIGPGLRWQVGARHANDNMLALWLAAEPQLLYFHRADKTASDFVVPQTIFATRLHLQTHLDLMTRNFMEMVHSGVSAGADAVWEHRFGWKDWGINGENEASSGRNPTLVSGWVVAAHRVPYLSDRHHLIGSVHLGFGWHLDRFSEPRIGGGPSGQDFGDLARPILPGAFIEEFPTSRYALGTVEYRWQALFFSFVGVRGTLAYLRRLRFSDGGIEEQDNFLAAIGARVTTGFLWRTQLQLAYTYNFGVVRSFGYGGQEILLHVSRKLW